MNSNNTIAAIATAQGVGGIGVIRISGEQAIEIADKLFLNEKGKKLSELRGYSALFGHIIENEEIIDEAVVLVFLAPHSYTGENVVEISCHGGMYVTKRVLRAVINSGAKVAEAGEFTKRAFLNGKMGLTEAESVMDIISAKGKSAAKAALSLKEGNLRKRIDKVKEKLVDNAAHLSAWADYPEEDIPEVEASVLLENLKEAKNSISQILREYDSGKAIREGIDTAIVGRPNVGKSTLMNLLSGCERSIVTNIPGTTRDIIEETVIMGDVILKLSDTAGIRETDSLVEKIGVEKTKDKIIKAGLVLAVFDSSETLKKEDESLIETLNNINSVAIINKTDLEEKIDIDYIKRNMKYVVYISAEKGSGIEDLQKAVEEITGTTNLDPSIGILATERQRDATEKALVEIKSAIEAINIGLTLDAVTVSIELAIGELLELTGERATEAVIDGVFSKFCVGK